MRVAILNAGEGPPDYLFGLVSGLAKIDDIRIDVVDSDNSIGFFDALPNVSLFNLRGNQRPSDPFVRKVFGILRYYAKLIRYTASSPAEVFHIQWDNSLFLLDRTILIWWYHLLGKKIVYTAHNLFKEERDGKGSPFRFRVLRHLYQTVEAVIVHTPAMQKELCVRFGVHAKNVHVVPHGINDRVRSLGMSRKEARRSLNILPEEKVLLFFGYLDHYKGPDLLLETASLLIRDDETIRVLIAGKPKRADDLVERLRQQIQSLGIERHVTMDLRFVPDDDVEPYFAASDCLVLPYRKIYQSGLIFLAYRFGLPVVATNVGNFRSDIEAVGAGFVTEENTANGLADAVKRFFSSDLARHRATARKKIMAMAEDRYSWVDIGQKTMAVYRHVLEVDGQ